MAEARLKGKLTLDDSQFAAVLRRSTANAARFAGSVGRGMAVGGAVGFAALTTAAIGTSVALATATKRALDLGGQFSDMRAQTGASVKSLVLLSQAFDDAGIGGENTASIINKMQKSIEGGGDAFEKLGINIAALKQMSPDKQLEAIGKAIIKLPTAAMQTAAAMEVFGKSGGKMLTLFKDDKALANAALILGSMPQILDRNADSFDGLSDKIGNTAKKLDAFGVGLAEKVAPLLDPILDKLLAIDTAKIGQGLGKDLGDAIDGQEPQEAIASLGGKMVNLLIAAAKSAGLGITSVLVAAFNEPLIQLQARIQFLSGQFLRTIGIDKTEDPGELTAQIGKLKDRQKAIARGEPRQRSDTRLNERIKDLERRRDQADKDGNGPQSVEEIENELRAGGGGKLWSPFNYGNLEGENASQMWERAKNNILQSGQKNAPATTQAVTQEAEKVSKPASEVGIATGEMFGPSPRAVEAQSKVGAFADLQGGKSSWEKLQEGPSLRDRISSAASNPRVAAGDSPNMEPSVVTGTGRATVSRVVRKEKILATAASREKAAVEQAAQKADKSAVGVEQGVNKIISLMGGD